MRGLMIFIIYMCQCVCIRVYIYIIPTIIYLGVSQEGGYP